MKKEDIQKMRLSLAKNYESIQTKIDKLMRNGTLDIKQLSDLERYVNMQSVLIGTFHTLESIVRGEF